MPPLTEWFQGRAAVAGFFAGRVLRRPGDHQLTATSANGQPAFISYLRGHGGVHHPHAIHVLTLDAAGIAHIAIFLDPAVCALFPARVSPPLP